MQFFIKNQSKNLCRNLFANKTLCFLLSLTFIFSVLTGCSSSLSSSSTDNNSSNANNQSDSVSDKISESHTDTPQGSKIQSNSAPSPDIKGESSPSMPPVSLPQQSSQHNTSKSTNPIIKPSTENLKLYPTYNDKVNNRTSRIHLTLENNSDFAIQLKSNFILEVLTDNNYEKIGEYPLDAASYQFPIEPRESGSIGAYFSKDILEKDKNLAFSIVPFGEYKITVFADDIPLSTEFQVVSEELPEDTSKIEITPNEKVISTDAIEITYTINNKTNNEYGFSPYPTLEYYYEEFQKWGDYHYFDGKERAIPSIAQILGGNEKLEKVFNFKDYKPLLEGEYRLTYRIDLAGNSYCNFTISKDAPK